MKPHSFGHTVIWQTSLAGMGAVVALSTLFWFVGLSPLIRQRAELVNQQQQLNQKRRTAGNVHAEVQDLRHNLEELELQLQHQSVRLQSVTNLNHQLDALTTLISGSGLQIDRIQPGQGSRSERYRSLDIHVEGSGPYPECARFFSGLHESFPDTRVASFELFQDGARQGDVRFRFRLVWHTLPSDQAGPGQSPWPRQGGADRAPRARPEF